MKRRRWKPEEKALVVLEGVKHRPIGELCAEHQISQGQYYQWRDQFRLRRPPVMHALDPDSRQIRQGFRVCIGRQPRGVEAPLWLLDATARSSPSRPTTIRIAGSQARRSASLTS